MKSTARVPRGRDWPKSNEKETPETPTANPNCQVTSLMPKFWLSPLAHAQQRKAGIPQVEEPLRGPLRPLRRVAICPPHTRARVHTGSVLGPLKRPYCFFMPETTSSMRRIMQAASIEVLRVCTFTLYGSQMPSSFMSASCPVLPSMPHVESSNFLCLARSMVIWRIMFAPQFWARVRGMTSRALPRLTKGPVWMPSSDSGPCRASSWAMAISVAPPPGSRKGSNTTLRITCMASPRFRSISLSTSLEPPRRRTVHALGSLHSVRKAKYSEPIFFTSKRPQRVPTSSGRISSGRCTMVAPVARAIRLLSVLRIRRKAVMLALTR
mmetsp:Transcript_8534/g.19377  ORF Transcript_8534/g.19377 Transcript_8534/m.19377 type:complete len:324 (-) Transcript_8534:1002-1973(-)